MNGLYDKVYNQCLQILRERHKTLLVEWGNLQQAGQAETKSSMGDKYETGREMLNLEKQKIATQLDEVKKQLKELETLSVEKTTKKVRPGILVKTERQIFFLAIPLGKIIVEDQEVFVLSPQSPLGQAMLNKVVGDEFGFGNQFYKISGLE